MATEDDVDALKLYWDHFFKAETGTYEKSTWLDLFLAEFLIRVKDGANPKELINFCPVSGVVTLVGCELLCGIHRITSSINTHYSAPLPSLDVPCSGKTASSLDSTETKPEEAKVQSASLFSRAFAQSSEDILRRYLLGGVAWRCLVLLRALGVEGLSCCRQLSSVLIWLFGELSGASAAAPAPAPAAPALAPASRTPIHQLFSQRIWAKQKPLQGSKTNSTVSSEKGSVTGRSRHSNHYDFPDGKMKRKPLQHSEQSSESADSNDDLQVLNQSLAIKVSAPNDDFEYFNSSILSSNEYADSYTGSYYSPRKQKPKPDDYMNEKHKEIINSDITAFEFTLIITDLLQELCKAESSLSGSEGSQISMQCINFSLRNLCSFQFSSLPSQNHTQDVSRIKVALTELLIVSLDKVLIHSDLCAKLINNGILPMLLRILEDVITKSGAKDSNRAKETNKTESENLLKFVFGIAYSITAFFHCLLMQCRSVDKLREFTDQFKLYGECLKGGLLKDCVELMIRIPFIDEEEVVVLIKKLIETIGKLVNGMKRVRSEVIHSAACPRSRHKICRQRVAAGMHHHHDILGEASNGLPMSSACCISVLYGTLTSLLTDEEVSAQSVLRNKILRVMLNCGVCCCFSPGILMESIVRLMLTHNTVASLCIQVLEHTVYGELGASVLIPKVTDQLPCSICEPCDEKKDVSRKFCQHPVGPVERKSVWSFLIHYNSLLQLDNHNNVLHATVSHLLRVTPKCRMEMKYELLFSVIYPTFIVAKHRYIIRLEESAYFLTVSCLNIFASLLNTVSFAEQFIQKGGLSYVLELVSLPEFSNQCCSILEIAIIVEIFKLMKENMEMTYYREMSSLSSVQMLFKSLSEMTDKCYNIYKLKLPIDKYEELIDVTNEREALAFVPSMDQVERKVSTPQTIKTTFAYPENTIEQSIEDHLEVLKNIWTFWKTCAGLCLYSPMFREYLVSESVLLDSYALLKLLLYYLCNAEYGTAEMRILIKIMEALLTVQLAVADVTSGRSKETSCRLVRAAVVAPASALEGGALRALCEALVRVAAAEPSRRHAMPRLAHAKVPPLLCPSGGSSAEGSSSEESAPALYGSEHSDAPAAPPDDGYEADVEINKFDLLPPFKNRKMSSTTSPITTPRCGVLEGPGAEPPPAEPELAHPELCVIVLDVLTQLIDKVLKCKGSECGGQAERAGAALARACCLRLAGGAAGAGAGAGAPGAGLLHRLLSSPTLAALLARTDTHLEELQRSVMELVEALAAQSVEPAELAALLRLFTAEAPPLSLLLPTLQRLASAAKPHTPDCILTFPILVNHAESGESLSNDFVHLTTNGTSSQSHVAETSANKLHHAHLTAGIRSVWSAGAARCGVEGAGWAPWLAGFALVLWVHAPPSRRENSENVNEESSEPETDNKSANKSPSKSASRLELSHVLSVGHDSLMFEMWLDTQAGVFTFRLTRPELAGEREMSAARASCVLPPHAACVAVNVRERVSNRNMLIQVTMFINGYECETVSLPVQGILVRKATPTHVVVGHAEARAPPAAGVFHLAAVSVYRAPLLSAGRAVHIAAHGPDSSCRVRCEAPNYASLLTPNVLDSNIDWDQVYEMSSTTLRELHEALLLTFSAAAPSIMNLYHQTSAQPAVFPAGGGAAPETLRVRWAGAALPSRHRGLAPALCVLQGAELLLYLYARVVELGGSAAEQALALDVLFRASRADSRLYTALHCDVASDMLLTVLAAKNCHLSPHLLKVIVEHACSAPVVRVCGGAVCVLGRTDAAVLEPALLVLLARAATALDCTPELTWEVEGAGGARRRQRGSLWALALWALRVLVRPSHPRRDFNHYQMSRHDLMNHLLLACKERFLNSEEGSVGSGVSESLVELVRALAGSPPPPHRLALLADFLLLMHQASDTFVTHSRANFYFLLTSETQEMSELFSSTRKRSSRRGKRRTHDRTAASTASAEDLTTDNSLGSPRDTTESRDDSDKMESSLESTKQLKGILNMQIKEGRKHNVSSTSENSDATAEAEPAEGSESEERTEAPTTTDEPPVDELPVDETKIKENGSPEKGDQTDGAPTVEDLAEYIVVDADDVNHTTVEMYSSGIYHQGRVRAGAAGGWATCEGLLLLLRDTIAVLPDHALQEGACGAVPAESVVVLASHRAGGVRAAAVRVLAALQRRARADLARRYRDLHYYVHLADQISLYEGTWELATACAALITKCDVPLEDQLDDDIWVDVSEEALQRSPPLLALLPCCLHAPPLADIIMRIICRIVDKASLPVLRSVSVCEVSVRTVRALGAGPGAARRALAPAAHALLARLATKGTGLAHGTQTVVDLHHMLTYVEQSAGEGEGVRRGARDAQVALYTAELDYLEERLHDACQESATHSNYFANVLTSAVSLGGGGGAGGARAELCSRLAGVASRAVSFLLSHAPHGPLGGDAVLLDRLLHMLPTVVSESAARPKWWVGSGAEFLAPLRELVWWALGGPVEEAAPAALRALYRAPPRAHALLAQDPPHMRKLAVYLVRALKLVHGREAAGACVEYAVTDWARGWALQLQAERAHRVLGAALHAEAARAALADAERWAHHAARDAAAVARAVFAKESLASRVAESAMSVTRAAVEAQNAERKRFLEHLRRNNARASAAALAWDNLIEAHTHDQGVWHDPRSYPQSWQLDSTEGAGRVRVRLRRAHLNIHPKFLKPHCRYKAETIHRPPPLRSVVGGSGGRGGLVARLRLHETVVYMARATCVTVASETAGELLLSDRCVHFVPEETSGGAAASWPLPSVRAVVTRRWCLREVAVELFLSSGHAHLLAFADHADRAAFLKALAACHLPGKIEEDSLSEAMSAWRSGAITNWEYLMRLNGLAGRSYNDLMQYPVLPFVIADYSSRILDLTRHQAFRDLSRPMAVQNKAREQHYIKIYNDLAAAQREGCSPLISRQPHHYASLYSNSGGVLHYLVRLPPFTQQFLNYQDNNFDMPDRTFHSLATTWRLITNDSPTDVKELIPELFYLPELFHNNEGLELGVRQCGLPVDSVELPPWAADARLFTLVHRQALEARAVTEMLPAWLDLVFGYKQTGQAARDALNVFPACTYYGFDPGALPAAEDRTAAAAMVRLYGQAPRQLLRTPHPSLLHPLTEHVHEVSVWGGVYGAAWGRYCGSPALGAPAVTSRRACAGAASVLALPHKRAAAALPRFAVLTPLASLAGEASSTPAALALLTWGHSDNVMRLKRRRDSAPDLLLHVPALDQITCVTSCACPECPFPVYVGHASGRVVCARVRAGAAALAPRVRTRVLLAHSHAIADLHACARAKLLLSASADGRIVLWDLNKLSYIRTIPNRDMMPVRLATISATLCDVATVHVPRPSASASAPEPAPAPAPTHAHTDDADADAEAAHEYERDAAHKYKSLIRVHTCNATFVGSVKVVEEVTAVCYSAAAEGVSVNCVAAGLRGGAVRLYSAWDLRPARLLPPAAAAPLLSLTYSSDSMILFGCYEGGTVVSWEVVSDRPAPVRVLPAHALL